MCNPVEAFTGPDSGAQARGAAKANKQTQSAVDYGMQQLNAIYGGGTYPIYSQAGGTISPGTSYFLNKPGGYKPLGDVNSNRQQKLFNQGKLYTSTPSQQYSGFNDNFYNKFANSYENFALPQLGQQFNSANQGIQFNLANRGLLGSGASHQANRDLQMTYAQQKQGIADSAQSQANSLRSQVNNSYQNAVSQLYQTANPANAQQSALASAAQFTAPSAFAPLANGFSSLVNQYAMQQQLAGSYAQGPGYFSSSPYGYSAPSSSIPNNQY